MLKIIVEGDEKFDENTNTFIPAMKPHTLILEHSLLSISKWEAIYHKPFLSSEKDFAMIKEYARCMTINPNVPEEVYEYLNASHINSITDYIQDNATATWFTDKETGKKIGPHKNGRMNGETITAEIVYYWMISMQIPVEFQKWHLNRLLTLIRVISVKSDPKSGTKAMTAEQRRALNKARQAKYHTRG